MTATDTGKTISGQANNDGEPGIPWRIVAWAVAALFLLTMVIGNQVSPEVNWTVGDFVFAGILLFGSLGIYEIAVRTTRNQVYRAGVGLSIAATFLLIWGNGAVHISDSPADGLYFGVGIIGVVGVIISLFRPGAGARTMFAAALALMGVSVFTLVAGMVPNPYVSVVELIGITGFYVPLFVGSAWLLREAAGGKPEQGAV